MAYQQATKDSINQAYKDIFGRDASFGTLGGADYWADQMDNQGLTLDQLKTHLTNSAEGQTVQTDSDGNKTSWLGGVNPNASIAAQQHADKAQTDPLKKTWASHFSDGGSLSGDLTGTIWEGLPGAGTATNATTNNVAGLLNATYNANNPNSAFPSPYYNNDPIVTTDANSSTTNIPGDVSNQGWWTAFADADAFKDFLTADADDDTTSTSDDGMGDFMKFMMLMSVMRGGGGFGGGGYGGSQYGYGGMNPGGVQAAYDPMANLQAMGTWFKDNFGSGSGSGGATTDSINAGAVLSNPANKQ